MKIIIFILVLFTQANAQSYYTQGTGINLRSQKSAHASIITKLKIGSRVDLIERDKKWSYVKFETSNGYIANFLLSKTKPTISSLLAEYGDAKSRGDLGDMRKYLERANALKPNNIQMLRKLLEVVKLQKDTIAIKEVEGKLVNSIRKKYSPKK